MAEDGLVAGNDDLIAAGLAPDDKDNLGEDAAALFGIDAGRPINLDDGDGDGDGGEGAIRTTVTSISNSTTPGTSTAGKRKSSVWATFDEVYEDVNGKHTCTKARCKICNGTLSARSTGGTGHLLRHKKSCVAKADRAAKVHARLAFNPDGSVQNWECNPTVARTELCRLIARLDLH